jgi:hypothetical protein
MRRGVVAALAALLLGHGSTSAQESEPYSAGHADPPAGAAGLRGSADYLLWWFKKGRIPPLVTAGGDGKIGSPGTQVLLDDLDFDGDVRQGGRFALGYQFARNPRFGIEAGYFFLTDRQTDVSFSSPGDPVLAQPYTDAVTGLPDASMVAMPGVAAGAVTVGSRTRLWGAEANLATGLACSDRFYLTGLGGFRYLSLEDGVTSGEQFRVSPDVPGFGGNSVTIRDEFRTDNQFYGGQVGLEAGVRFDLLTVDFRARIALGQMRQVATVSGVTSRLSPAGSTDILPGGGLYALSTNSGRHQRDDLAFIPEAGVNLGFRVTDHVKLTAGYSFLWVSTVTRAGEHIDPVLNGNLIPIKESAGPVGPARPAFNFDGSDFWAQGLNLGLELRY